MEPLSAPPGFVSLTSFFLKKDDKVEKTSKSDPIPAKTKPEMDDNTSYNQINAHRPWIVLDQNRCKSEESCAEHLPRVKLVIFQFFLLMIRSEIIESEMRCISKSRGI